MKKTIISSFFKIGAKSILFIVLDHETSIGSFNKFIPRNFDPLWAKIKVLGREVRENVILLWFIKMGRESNFSVQFF